MVARTTRASLETNLDLWWSSTVCFEIDVETTLLSPSSTPEPSVAASAAPMSNSAHAEGSRGLGRPYSGAGTYLVWHRRRHR